MCVTTMLLAMALTSPAPAHIRVTHRDLVVSTLDGQPMEPKRSATLSAGEHVLVIGARESRGGPAAGLARLRFIAETGHRYEIEVRAAAAAYGPGPWRPGAWTPVVRDRGVSGRDDGPPKLVSGPPEWLSSAGR
jgi:hypothetical protein